MILIKTLVFFFAMPARICVSASRAPEGFVPTEASQTLLQYLVKKFVINFLIKLVRNCFEGLSAFHRGLGYRSDLLMQC